MHQLETTLAQLQLRAAQLADKRALAEAALASATAARQAFRLEGDLADDKLDAKLHNEVDVCHSKLAGLDADIVALQAKVTETEQQLTAERTAAERKAASEKLALDLDKVEEALPACLEAGRRFVSALEELHHNFEAGQMAAFLANALSQVEVASGFVLQELRGTVRGILDGSMPIPAPKPQPAPAVVSEPAPETRPLFTIRSIKWRDAKGKLQVVDQYCDADLPVHLAERALRSGACVSINSDLRRQNHGSHGGRHPNPDYAVDLDAVSDYSGAQYLPPNDPVIVQANFVQINRGPERMIAFAEPRV